MSRDDTPGVQRDVRLLTRVKVAIGQLRAARRSDMPLVWRIAVNGLAASVWMPTRARVVIYKICGMSVPLLVNARPGITIRTQRLWLGPGTSLNARCLFDNRADVIIGRNVGVGFDVHFITSTHDPSDPRVRAGRGAALPIRVGDGAWLGSRVSILAGVTIGDGCVIAAGAVVTKDCMPNGLYGGVPAKRIRDLPE